MPHIYGHGVTAAGSDTTASQKEKRMSSNKFPEGWDEARVKRVLQHYETQTDEEAVAEDEAAVALPTPL